jgi:hypothetical protein
MTMPAEVREGFLFKIEKENAASHAPWIPGPSARRRRAGAWPHWDWPEAPGAWPHYKAGKITLISVFCDALPPAPRPLGFK